MIIRLILFFLLFALGCRDGMAQNTRNREVCRIALIQASLVWGDVEANLLAFDERLGTCERSDLIVLPELFTSGCAMKKKKKEDGVKEKEYIASYYPEVVRKMSDWAVRKQAVVMGSTVYSENGLFYNRLIVSFPDGSYRYYDKHNCFKMGGYTPGEGQLIFDYKGWKIATYICYDLRFEEWSRNTEDYDMAVYVANWPASRRESWKALLRERAAGNKAVIVGVNCAGADTAGLMYAGDSSVIGPDGQVMGSCREYMDEIIYVNVP